MGAVAVFVDAGYLFAQGSVALNGEKIRRNRLTLNPAAAISALIKVATERTGGQPLLRVYWYDGARGNIGLSPDHTALAHMDYLKLRLGFLNGAGEQKGVDSLIVTDLIELARNRAMTDAVLLSGDEDVRVGVQIAQSFGVRVHLLGIIPARGSQSLQLMQEADTTGEWDTAIIQSLLTVTPSRPATNITPAVVSEMNGDTERFAAAALRLQGTLTDSEIGSLQQYLQSNSDVPRQYDGRLLAFAREDIGRDLEGAEKRQIRKLFKDLIERSR